MWSTSPFVVVKVSNFGPSLPLLCLYIIHIKNAGPHHSPSIESRYHGKNKKKCKRLTEEINKKVRCDVSYENKRKKPWPDCSITKKICVRGDLIPVPLI